MKEIIHKGKFNMLQYRFKLKGRITGAHFLLAFIILVMPVRAGAGWLDDMTVSSTPSMSDVSRGVFVWGGNTSLKIPSSTVRPFHVKMPSIRAGCGGIDAFWGGFSMLDPDMLVQYAQNILSAAPSYAFNLALQTVCENCQAIMTSLNDIANNLNGISMDSCAGAQKLANFGEPLINSMNTDKTTIGEATGRASDWLKERAKNVSDFSASVNDFFNDQNIADKLDPLSRHLAVPDAPNRVLSFWVTVIAENVAVSGSNFSSWQPGFEAAQGFFSSPAQLIEYFRSVSGDFMYRRGSDGTPGPSLLAGTLSSDNEGDATTPADKPGTQVIARDATYHTDLEISPTGVATIKNPLDSIARFNNMIGTSLNSMTPDDNYTTQTQTSGGWSGFPDPGKTITCNRESIISLQPPVGGYSSPLAYFQNDLQNIMSNLDASTGNSGATTNLNSYMLYQEFPVYVFTNKIGLLSQEYPGIIPEVVENLAVIGTYSYITARLNHVLGYGSQLLSRSLHAIHQLKDKEYPHAQELETWIKDAQHSISQEQKWMKTAMYDRTEASLKKISQEIKKYIELEKSIKNAVSSSIFSVTYKLTQNE
ncbi:Putative Type IV secretion system protein TraH [Desulfonema limicola]|uniref:Type IV secretion system protein TraH n=2 Tax=Desulfonema limicola TaxID=45656 RepID=A0A975B485_9BACT|nr:Putative Type IV secretion system protein TraH [Desulfonema limicola]